MASRNEQDGVIAEAFLMIYKMTFQLLNYMLN